jgi:hypothetical protein
MNYSTHRDRVFEVLEANSEGLCEMCLEEMTQISPHQTVNQICRGAANSRQLRREKASCNGCQRRNVYVCRISVDRVLPTHEPESSTAGTAGKPAWFEEIRHQLVRMINQVDPSSKSEGFSRRVSDLRNKGHLAGNIACLMLTWTAFRNIVCFDEYCLSSREKQALVLLREELLEWMRSRSLKEPRGSGSSEVY